MLANLAAILPPCAARGIGSAVGEARRIACPSEARIVAENLHRLGLDHPADDGAPARDRGTERERLVRATFRSFGWFVIEFLRGLTLSAEQIARGWQIRGGAHLAGLRERRRGCILAGAHTGNWEHLGALAGLLGRRIVAPAGVQLHPLLSSAIKRAKEQQGVTSVPPDRRLRTLLRALARGDLVALPLDGGSYRRGVLVHLCGRRVWLAAGAVRLALLSGCPILPVFSRRLGFMRQEVHVLAPIEAPRGSIRGAERDLTQHLADLLTAHLRRSRGQWCLFRRLAWYNQM